MLEGIWLRAVTLTVVNCASPHDAATCATHHAALFKLRKVPADSGGGDVQLGHERVKIAHPLLSDQGLQARLAVRNQHEG